MYHLQITLPKNNDLTPAMVDQFNFAIYEYYKANRRNFAWREHITPYRVVVSEIMLQQTQTDRVAPKFDLFIAEFPDFQALASAPFDHVLRFWKGLGYNRRAQALQKIARLVVDQYDGVLPDDPELLKTFPGIGPATAASIVAFAYNKPTAFIETNIRTVFIYTFFQPFISFDYAQDERGDKTFVRPERSELLASEVEWDRTPKNRSKASLIKDSTLLPLIIQTLDHHNPREWYYALMDYGVMLKKEVGNISRLSAHYSKQSRFEGSDRQIRGHILQVLLDQPGIGDEGLIIEVKKDPIRVMRILRDLEQENFLMFRDAGWWLVK